MMYSNEEVITPEIAEAYLTRNKANRKIKFKAVRNYARDMKNGKWQMNPDGICFYEDGTLANGQHRLMAVVRAKTPTKFYVTRNVPMDAFIFDRGVSRSTVDVLNMTGKASSVSDTQSVALVNYLFALCGNTAISDDIRVDFLIDNEELVSKARSITALGTNKNRVCRQAPVMAAVFCALYCGINEEVLKEFCSVANTGFSTSNEQTAAIVLRKFMDEKYCSRNWYEKKAAFITAACAIKDFNNKKPRRFSYPTDSECKLFDVTRKGLLDPYLASYDKLA